MLKEQTNEIMTDCIKSIVDVGEKYGINVKDENFVKDLALSSSFIRAAFNRQLGKSSALHEGMSDFMNSVQMK